MDTDVFNFLRETVKGNLQKYPELLNHCSPIKETYIENHDASCLFALSFSWDPQLGTNWTNSEEQFLHFITEQSEHMFIGIKQDILNQDYDEYFNGPAKIIYGGSNIISQPMEEQEHLVITWGGGDILTLHCNDESFFLTLTISGQW